MRTKVLLSWVMDRNSRQWPPPPGPERPRRNWWKIVGVTLAVLFGVAGLVIVGLFVAFAVAVDSWAANK